MKRTKEVIAREIEALNREIGILDREQEAYDKLSDGQRLAIILHELLCHHNHSDGCSWLYEIKDGIHDWDTKRHAHNHYVKMSQALIHRVARLEGDEEALKYTLPIIAALAEVK